MSRAFVKELDGAEREDLPELTISPHRNFVTPAGLVHIEETVRRLEAELAGARKGDDKATQARVERDLRYWTHRKASAEVVPPASGSDEVRFGSSVQLETEAGERLSFRIVGEDESDPAHGLVSYVSPLAEALLGGTVGDEVPFRNGVAEIVGID